MLNFDILSDSESPTVQRRLVSGDDPSGADPDFLSIIDSSGIDLSSTRYFEEDEDDGRLNSGKIGGKGTSYIVYL